MSPGFSEVGYSRQAIHLLTPSYSLCSVNNNTLLSILLSSMVVIKVVSITPREQDISTTATVTSCHQTFLVGYISQWATKRRRTAEPASITTPRDFVYNITSHASKTHYGKRLQGAKGLRSNNRDIIWQSLNLITTFHHGEFPAVSRLLVKVLDIEKRRMGLAC